MANYDQRVLLDDRFGQISAGVDSLATTLASPDFTTLPSDLSAVKYLPIVLADDSQKLYEVVWVTGHAASSQSITVVRGREGSSGRAWGTGTLWRCAPTARDAMPVYASRAALPGDGHLGMRAFVILENTPVQKTSLGWQALEPPFGHVGATAGFQSIASGNGAYVVFSAAQDLSGGMTFSDSDDALIAPIPGRYMITTKGYTSGGSPYSWLGDAVINSTTLPPPAAARAGARFGGWKGDAADSVATASVTRRLAAGDKVRLWESTPNSTYGSTGYDGAWLEVLYVGP